jgi:hypothetical protein
MRTHSGSISLFKLKALYALSLLALCIYIVSGPALAGTIGSTVGCGGYDPTIPSTDTSVTVTSGIGSAVPGSIHVTDPYTVALENVSFSCDPSSQSACSARLDFWFFGTGYSDPFQLWVHLTGTSTDPGAYGSLRIDGVASPANWTANSSGGLSMDDLGFTVTPYAGNGNWWEVNGHFYVDSLAIGKSISWGSTSLDFNQTPPDQPPPVPEPTSAVVVVAGLAWIEFLRRKCHR